jgi:hypothetical protein
MRVPRIVTAIIVTASLLGFATPPVVQAQSVVDEQQQQLAQIESDKQTIVFQAMDLDDAQVAAFTPVYDAYQAEYKKIMDRAVALRERFAANYDSMTDETAEAVLKDWFRLKQDEDRLIQAYAKKLRRVLPATRVLRFVQIENQLSAVLRLAAVRGVPLAK